jgi:tetratricopeptide (TPR) repeat protein
MTDSDAAPADALLAGQRVALVGKLAGMSKRQAQQLLRKHAATVVEQPDGTTTLVVAGEQDSADVAAVAASFSEPAKAAYAAGSLQILSESQLWQQLGLVDRLQDAGGLYTAAMLAGLIKEPVATIRRWQRLGWLLPTREVRRLAYFDFEEVATARRVQELLAAGMSSAAITRALATLSRQLPDVRRPLAELSIVIEGKQLLVRQDEGLVEPSGQLRFDFDAAADLNNEASDAASNSARGDSTSTHPSTNDTSGQGGGRAILAFAPHLASHPQSQATAADLLESASELEAQGDLAAAAEMYRAALAAGGPSAETCFLLAEVLYQLHDLPAARERYYMAVELNDDYVEARANLGCVLAELGEYELAVSAFQGALAFHDDYEDAHYHLGRTLDQLGRADEAADHWQAFLRLAPSSPWADEARERLGQ